MSIRMTTSIVGAGFDLHPGDETDRFSKEEELRFIASGSAVLVMGEEVERAVTFDLAAETRAVAPEYTGKRRGRPRKAS